MADRKTRDALLRLRRVHEIDAKRALGEARTALSAAEEAKLRALENADDARSALTTACEDPPPQTAGGMAIRERYLDRLRAAAATAAERAKRAAREAAAAETRLHQAQAAVETALRTREAAESQEAALKLRTDRQRARREDSANHDQRSWLVKDRFSNDRRRRRK